MIAEFREGFCFMRRLTAIFLAALALQLSLLSTATAAERPPQFVLMALDNCTELDRWQEWVDFLKEVNRDGDRVHLTFFVSGVNFLAGQNRKIYKGPLAEHRRGASSINFGGTPENVRRRVTFINALHQSGNEIASHAVGHFPGGKWSPGSWVTEFKSYQQLFGKVAGNNGLPPTVKFDFPPPQSKVSVRLI